MNVWGSLVVAMVVMLQSYFSWQFLKCIFRRRIQRVRSDLGGNSALFKSLLADTMERCRFNAGPRRFIPVGICYGLGAYTGEDLYMPRLELTIFMSFPLVLALFYVHFSEVEKMVNELLERAMRWAGINPINAIVNGVVYDHGKLIVNLGTGCEFTDYLVVPVDAVNHIGHLLAPGVHLSIYHQLGLPDFHVVIQDGDTPTAWITIDRGRLINVG